MTTELSAYAAEVFGTAGLPEKTDFDVLFAAPIGDAVPEDGVFVYTTINNLSDVGLVKARSVILFREDQAEALTVLSRHSEQFARTVQPLFGVPGGNYGVWFDDATLVSTASRTGRSSPSCVPQKRSRYRQSPPVAAARTSRALATPPPVERYGSPTQSPP